MTPGVLILAGQTASGKTALALDLAERFGAEIVGADSRQIYRGMPVGTAAPTPNELARVRHHLVGIIEPNERYSAARFVRDALAAIDDIHARGKRAIVAGGTGFYLRALTGGVGLSPVRDEALRGRLAHEARVHPVGVLFDWLRALDAVIAARVPPADPYRVTRALEIALASRDVRPTGAPQLPVANADASRADDDLLRRGVVVRKLYLERPAAELQQRIEARIDAMLASGFIDEAERIGRDAVAADAVGYREALAYRAGWMTPAEFRTALVRNTRRYAKRQATWFRAEPDLTRIAGEHAHRDAAAVAMSLPGWHDRA